MHFSSRVDISAPNPIAAAEAAAKANGIALSKLNDSNPTRHGLAPELVPSVYTADPRGRPVPAELHVRGVFVAD